MTTTLLQRRVDVDPLEVAAAWASRPGTLLLHTQRDWNGSGLSALLFDPRWVLRAQPDGALEWDGVPPPAPVVENLLAEGPLSAPLRGAALWPASRHARPVFAGLAGHSSYDLGAAALGGRHGEAPPFAMSDLWLGAYDLALVFDARGRETPRLVAADLSPLVPCAGEAALRDRLEAGLEQLHERSEEFPPDGTTSPPVHLDPQWHATAVERIQRELRAGNTYQINLTGLAEATTGVTPWSAFLDQAHRNPVAFAAYLRCDAHTTITSHSPERLLRLRGARADTAPIKGTVAAGPGATDRLLASDKDRAEHVMIVDLCRNDLGRHAQVGSVHVPSLMESLPLSRLTHLVSRVEARVPRRSRHHLLRDLFPGGSITGAPKRSSVRIIAEVERHARGVYTGSVGFVDRGGHADWNIAIRTAVWQNGRVYFGCGGGITVDSDPALEYEEAVLKASSFFESLRALGARSATADPPSPLSGAAP